MRFLPALWVVDHPLDFLAAEARRSGLAVYGLRGQPVELVVRHGAGALELLYEIFHERCYEPPESVVHLIPRAPRILDLGANVGAFAAYALIRWPRASLTCVEPDRDNLVALHEFRSRHPWANVRVVPACAGARAGTVGFAAGLGTGSRVAEGAPQSVAVDALPLLNEADFAKIDIEGSEWPILRDSRLASVERLVLVMEYHRRFPFDSGAGTEARNLLDGAGFEVIAEHPNYWGHGLMWAVKGGSR